MYQLKNSVPFFCSIKTKLFSIIVLTIVVTLLLFFRVFSTELEQVFRDQTTLLYVNEMDQVIETIDGNLNFIQVAADQLLYYQTLLETSKEVHSELREGKQLSSELTKRLVSALVDQPVTELQQYQYLGLHSIALCLEQQDVIIDSLDGVRYGKEGDYKRRFDVIEDMQKRHKWVSSDWVNSQNDILTEDAQSIIYTLPINISASANDNVLKMKVDEYYIYDNFNAKSTGDGSEAIILSAEDVVVSYDDKAVLGRLPERFHKLSTMLKEHGMRYGSFRYDMDGKDYLAIYNTSFYTGWRYVRLLPMDVLQSAMFNVPKILSVLIVIVIAALIVTWFVAGAFYNPLQRLLKAMKQVGRGNFTEQIQNKRRDEYKEVYSGFNRMTAQIDKLLKNLTDERILNQEMQIRFLQSQINPHFLYNTLDSMYAIASLNDMEELSQMIVMLSRFYRKKLGKGMQTGTLYAALELVNDYVAIQNIRFHNKIVYTCDVPTKLYQCMIPVLLLQPIVENAIFHGIEKRNEKGEVTLRAYSENGVLYIEIEDNGIGMSEEKLEILRKEIMETPEEIRFTGALNNINHLLRLKYGTKFGIVVTSASGKGTKVVIRLPEQYLGD